MSEMPTASVAITLRQVSDDGRLNLMWPLTEAAASALAAQLTALLGEPWQALTSGEMNAALDAAAAAAGGHVIMPPASYNGPL